MPGDSCRTLESDHTSPSCRSRRLDRKRRACDLDSLGSNWIGSCSIRQDRDESLAVEVVVSAAAKGVGGRKVLAVEVDSRTSRGAGGRLQIGEDTPTSRPMWTVPIRSVEGSLGESQSRQIERSVEGSK